MKSAVVVVNHKRSQSEEHEERPPSKSGRYTPPVRHCDRPTHSRAEAPDEQRDLNNPAWDLQKLREPADFFAHVQSTWRLKTPTVNPHTNLTIRHNPTPLRTGFNLSGSNNDYINSEIIYNDRMRIINYSLRKIHSEIVALEQNRRYARKNDRTRLNYLRNYRNQLRNKLDKLENAKRSARSLYSFYHDPVTGRDGNFITFKQKCEAQRTIEILNTFQSFYGSPC